MADHAPSTLVKEAARSILRHLRERPDGATKDELGAIGGVSRPSVQRALRWLREECDSPVDFDRATNRWVLRDPHFSLPMSDPDPEDLAAVLLAQSLLGPIADDEITARIRRLAEQMDAEIRNRRPDAPTARAQAMTATVTTGGRIEPDVLRVVLAALGRGVIRIAYHSPWSEPATTARDYDVEPWQLRSHDGTLYLRAWSRGHAEARIFNLSQVDRAERLDKLTPAQPLPSPGAIWGDDDPAFGIDHDRPDTAVVLIRGAVARWVHRRIWHPAQRDRWIDPGVLLERRLPYRSCRELARRLLSIGEGVESIEPPALRDEVLARARALGARLGDPP